ncbi:MAG: NAD(P)-dependent oxidoreductase [Planctomycetes bacterium]|nr:NAD(P)-dependent oxidoreductase [Planctomycetota bacterium]
MSPRPMDLGPCRGRRLLVLGGAGFLGSHVVDLAVAHGAVVTVIDGLVADTGGSLENLAAVRDRVEVLSVPVEEVSDLERRLADADLVVDAMGYTRHREGARRPRHDLELNLLSHLALVEALRRVPSRRVIYLGSRGQYGDERGQGIDEGSPLRPADTQGIAKGAAEHYLRVYAGTGRMDVASLRLTHCFGERQLRGGTDLGLVGSMVAALLAGREVEVWGSSDRRLNLAYGPDVARAVLALGLAQPQGFEAYNLGGFDLSLGELLSRLMPLTGGAGYRVVPVPGRSSVFLGGPYRDRRLRRRIGPWKLTPLDAALHRTVAWFRQPAGLEWAR